MNEGTSRLLSRADALLGQGRRKEAIEAYRQVLAVRPTQADAWFNLGYALKHEGAYEQALHAYAQAIAMRASMPEEIHLNRAIIYADHLHQDQSAEQELRAALSIAPGFVAALLNLGNLHEERGQREEAIDCYRRILVRPLPTTGAANSASYEALARMAHLSPPNGPDDPLLLQLQQAATTLATIDDSLRANLYLALGHAHDAMGDYDLAFGAFESGKRFAHRRYPPYASDRERERTDALISAFPAMVMDTEVRRTTYAPEPLFICGMFRSGSTLLEQVLAAHPAIVPAGELDLLPRMTATELAPFPESVMALDPERCIELAARYHARLSSMLMRDAKRKSYVTDKRPDNYRLIGLIKRLFPHAKIIHTHRNPLDNALSVFMQHLNPRVFDYAGNLASIGHYYGQHLRLMAHWKSLYPRDIHDFDYDAFVARPKETLESLLGFLGLDWNEDCLQFHRQANTVRTASYWQVRRPLYGEASGRWRNYEIHLAPLRQALGGVGIDVPVK